MDSRQSSRRWAPGAFKQWVRSGPQAHLQGSLKCSLGVDISLHDLGFASKHFGFFNPAPGLAMGGRGEPFVMIDAKARLQVGEGDILPRDFDRTVAKHLDRVALVESADLNRLRVIDLSEQRSKNGNLTRRPAAHGLLKVRLQSAPQLLHRLFAHSLC